MSKRLSKEDLKYKKAVIEIITNQKIERQEDIRELLSEHHGFEVSQPTISRLLTKIGVERDPEKRYYVLSSKQQQLAKKQRLKEFLDPHYSEAYYDTLVITIKTKPGFADAAGTMLKETYPEHIIGTIAQNDLLLVVIESEESKDTLRQFIDQL